MQDVKESNQMLSTFTRVGYISDGGLYVKYFRVSTSMDSIPMESFFVLCICKSRTVSVILLFSSSSLSILSTLLSLLHTGHLLGLMAQDYTL